MTDIELEKEIKKRVIPALRKVSRFWKCKAEAKRRAKVSPGKFKCEKCYDVVGDKEIEIDHIKPVVDVKQGFVDWNTYVSRLLVNSDGLAALCKPCHSIKTQVENEMRKKYKQIRKTSKKSVAKRYKK